MASLKQRLKHMAISLDQLVGSIITLGAAFPDETMSSYAYRLEAKGKFFGLLFRPLIDGLFFWMDEHCRKSWENEKLRYQLPPELR
jgi:hypothetical protein